MLLNTSRDVSPPSIKRSKRNILKNFISLYNNGEIDEELLNLITEIILQAEIEDQLDNATSKFEKKAEKYLKQIAYGY